VTEHLVIRTSLSVASIRLLQAALPAFAVMGTLFVLALLLNVPFDEFYVGLAAVAGTLSSLILRPPRFGSLGLQTSRTSLAIDIALGWGLVVAILLALGFVVSLSEYFARRVLLPWIFIAPTVIVVGSFLLQEWMRAVILSSRNQRSAVIAGVNEAGLQLASNLVEHPELCMRLVGFFDDRNAERLGDRKEVALVGKLSALPHFVKEENIDVIFIALPIRHVQRVMTLLDELRDTTASIYFVPDIFMYDLIQSRTADIWGMPVVALCETPFYGYRGVLKRVTDITLTLGALVPALPIMAILAILIKATSPGPAIFRQIRYGLDGQEIVVYKFRSMFVTENGPRIPQATKNDPRITSIGRILRKYSLDELPQLFNVLQGRMSLVGPRPHAVAHNEQYRHLIKGYMIRHKVLPGITGLAQVNGCRGETSDVAQMQARLQYDLDYLRHWTPIMDIKILLKTVLLVFRDPKAY
jgi:putative colanic acid biosynthesis UDP-glucose lipid carrier transferase